MRRTCHTSRRVLGVKMNKRLIHKNLSTTFVDIDGLIRHLRGLQFVGVVHIELCSYEADIIFTPSKRLQARERDHASGLTTQGADAFRRILLRAREPNGRLHVYQAVGNDAMAGRRTHVDAAIAARARLTISSTSDSPAKHLIPKQIVKPEPFNDWDVLLNLTAELLNTVDISLETNGLPFAEAFGNACAIVAAECPFVDPNRGLFEYRDGKVRLGTTISRERFVGAVMKALGRIFDRLCDDPELEKIHECTARQIRTLMHIRNDIYETLGFSTGLNALIHSQNRER
jgi:hypothetical protein